MERRLSRGGLIFLPACVPIIRRSFLRTSLTLIALSLISISRAGTAPTTYDLAELPPGATPHKVIAVPVQYRGRKALKVEFTDEAMNVEIGVSVDNPTFVMIPANFKNGTIEVDVLGRLNGKGPVDSRAFVGLVYRVVDPEARFESIYLRPLNGRKKNPPSPRDKRAIQYFAYPDWKFPRLRQEYPDGRYEAGADIGDDEWITLKLDIEDNRVQVSINGKRELDLTETKASPMAGGIGLWVGIGAAGYFSNLRVSPR